VSILCFEWSILTNKSKEDRFKALDLKTVLSDFCGQRLVCELILVLVSLWLLVNSFKETFKEKRLDYFIIIFLKIFLLFYYYFLKIFWLFYYFFEDILIILLLFCFFYLIDVTTWTIRLNFILIVIKQDYNTNDWLKFILSIIRRDNGLNKQ